MEQEADFIKLQSNLTLSLFNMHLETEKIGKEISDLYGLLELMQALKSWGYHIQNLLAHCLKKI